MKRRTRARKPFGSFRLGSAQRSGKLRRLEMETLEHRRVLAGTPLEGGGVIADDGTIYFSSAEEFMRTYVPADFQYDPTKGPAQKIANIPNLDDIVIYETTNVDAADSTNAEDLQPGGLSGLDLTGAGIRVGVWDGGDVRDTHQEFPNGNVTVHDNSGISDHATHVTGTIAAVGTDPNAHGMAPGVTIGSWDFDVDGPEIAANAGTIDASNHSYGPVNGWSGGFLGIDLWLGDYSISMTEDAGFGRYTDRVSQYDQTFNANPHLLSVWAAGNDHGDAFQDISGAGLYWAVVSTDFGFPGFQGPGLYVLDSATYPAPPADGEGADGFDTISGGGIAKNSLTIGAANDATDDPKDPTTLSITGFSSVGPADDGRIKPDLVANGANLYSPVGTGDTDYGTFSGTSMATPNTTGSIALLMEHYVNLFGEKPDAVTIKNALIHTATEAGRPGPDYVYGWGYVDALAAATFLTNAAADTGGDKLLDGTYNGTELVIPLISEGINPLSATIVWNDPAAQGEPSTSLDNRASRLVNDLDIWIVSPGGQTHRPWTLDPDNPTAPAVQSAANHRDNVEQVSIDSPVKGIYTLYVSHTGTVSPQDYSLLASGVDTAAVQGVKFQDVNGDGVQDTGEQGLPGWTIYVDSNDNGTLDSGEESTVTNTLGQYVLSLAPGDYVIREVMQENWTQTFPAGDGAHRITVPPGGVALTDIDFGNRADPGTINGLVWSDLNQNAQRDSGEPGLANVTVYIDLDSSGTLTEGDISAVTSGAGTYQLAEVPVGTHTIRQVPRTGLIQTFPLGGAPHTVTVAPAQVINNINFGDFFQPATIAGFVWHDLNGDGTRQGGERGIANMLVYLDFNRDNRVSLGEPSVRTNDIGRYEFTVAPGDTYIGVSTPLGFTQSFPANQAPQHVPAMPNELYVNRDFGLRSFSADFGDAPQPYPTRSGDGGASHEFKAGPILGTLRTADLNGQPSSAANADSGDDGVQFITSIEAGQTATVEVTASVGGFLSAWIDFNGDGIWNTEAPERIIVNREVGPTPTQFTFAVPTSTKEGTSFARFRLSSIRGLLPTGLAPDGEVEDYAVALINNIPTDGGDDGDTDGGTDTGDGDTTPTPNRFNHTNSLIRNDVDGDGRVRLDDALHIVAELRANGAHNLSTPTAPLSLWLDTDGNGRVNLSDALEVVYELVVANRVAAATAAASEGEGESASESNLAASTSSGESLVTEGEYDDAYEQAVLAETATRPEDQLNQVAQRAELDESVELIAADLSTAE